MSDLPLIALERQQLLASLAAQAAAWWRTTIAAPGYLSKFDNGDRSEAGELAQVLASFGALKSPQPAVEAFDRFELLLTEAVLARLLLDPSPRRPEYTGPARYCVLSVDYGPEGLLAQAAQQADVAGFPWKTTMWVNWDADPAKCYLEVRAGYGRPTQRLPEVAPAPAP